MRLLLVGPDLEANLSLTSLVAALRQAGHCAQIAAFNTPADADAVLTQAEGGDAIGLSLSFQIRAPQFLELAGRLKQQEPSRPVIAGGHFASCAAEELLRDYPQLDLIVLHEAERTLVELAELGRHMLSRAGEIAGVVHRADGAPARSTPRPVVEDLDSLPWPDRSGPARLVAGVPTAYMMGSRGCVRACDYCCIATLHRCAPGPRFRRRSAANIAAEMAQLYRDGGVRQYVFHDDNFLVPNQRNNHQRLTALEQAIAERGLRDIGLVMKSGPRDVRRPALEQLKRMGLLRIFLGIESSTQVGMDSIGRRQSPVEAEAAVALCESLGISSQYTMITFHPEASVETMLSDLDFVERHPAHPLNYCRAEIYAGTPLEQRVLRSGRAVGSYMARTYRYQDPKVELVWDVGKDLFAGRCWGRDDLLGQVIRLDHQFAVLRHFYDGAEVRRLAAEFDAWEVELNLETAGLFRQLVLACAEARDAGSPLLKRKLAELEEQERRSRPRRLEQICALKQGLERLTAPVIDLVVRPGPLPSRWSQLPRHAAAVLVAAGMMGCPTPPGPDVGHPEQADVGHSQQADAATPAQQTIRDDFGVMEAAPPPFDGLEPKLPDPDAGVERVRKRRRRRARRQDAGLGKKQVRQDNGIQEAAPPPYDDLKQKQVLFDDGIQEAAPPPIQPEPTGSLMLRTTPPTEVRIDGESFGMTPLFGLELPVGRHRVKMVNKEQNISVTRTITIKRDQETRLRLELE